jgi:hypothetical protein
MYWNVPRSTPASVSGFSTVASTERPPAAGAATLARPKSSSFAPVRVSMMLPGFRSRWTTPLRWALSRRSAISTA